MRIPFIVSALSVALAACQPAADNETATADTEGGAAPAQSPSPGEPAGSSPSSAPTATATGDTIPASIQGRWGMVPADCTSTRGDAKGLLTVSPTTLRFYESVGRLGDIKERSDSSLRADYAFTGEGMEWTRDVTLTVSDGGRTLTRTDRGGEEPGGPFTYTKCTA